jgi:hypothetical protein
VEHNVNMILIFMKIFMIKWSVSQNKRMKHLNVLVWKNKISQKIKLIFPKNNKSIALS